MTLCHLFNDYNVIAVFTLQSDNFPRSFDCFIISINMWRYYMFVIMGITGKVGSAVANTLLDANQPVRGFRQNSVQLLFKISR